MTEETKTAETTTEQPAVAEQPNPTQKDEVEAESSAAQNDGLDELLKEFDQRRESPKPEKPTGESENKTGTPVDVNALATVEQRLNEYEAREQRRELERLFTDLSDGTSADAIDAEAYLNARALREPKLNQLYQNRDSNPQLWAKAWANIKQDFSKRHKKVDKTATESRNAVESAIRSASTAAPREEVTSKEVQSMSKDDFDNLQRKLGVQPL